MSDSTLAQEIYDLLKDVTLAGVEADDLKRHLFYGQNRPEPRMPQGYSTDEEILERVAEDSDANLRDIHALLGIISEVGELVDAFLTKWETGDMDHVNLKEELGDLPWYQNLLIENHGTTWEEVFDKNIRKLSKRFPKKFTEGSALNRDLLAERNELES